MKRVMGEDSGEADESGDDESDGEHSGEAHEGGDDESDGEHSREADEGGDDEESGGVNIGGLIEDVVVDEEGRIVSIRIQGVEVVIGELTDVLGALEVGSWVEIKAVVSDGVLTAEQVEVKRHDREEDSDEGEADGQHQDEHGDEDDGEDHNPGVVGDEVGGESPERDGRESDDGHDGEE